MIIGVGTDILAIPRIRRILDMDDGSFRRRVYTAAEIALIEDAPEPLFHYATRFAGKEAIFKALSPAGEIRLNEMEILEEHGRPVVFLHGRAAEYAAEKGIAAIHISLSYETDCAVAFAAAEG